VTLTSIAKRSGLSISTVSRRSRGLRTLSPAAERQYQRALADLEAEREESVARIGRAVLDLVSRERTTGGRA